MAGLLVPSMANIPKGVEGNRKLEDALEGIDDILTKGQKEEIKREKTRMAAEKAYYDRQKKIAVLMNATYTGTNKKILTPWKGAILNSVNKGMLFWEKLKNTKTFDIMAKGFKGLSAGISKMAGKLSDIAKGLGGSILGFLTDLIKIALLGPDILGEIINALIELATFFINFLIKALPGIITALVSLLPKLITSFVNMFDVLIKAVVAKLPEIIKALVNLISLLVSKIPEIIKSILNAFISLIQDSKFITSIIDIFKKVVDALKIIIPELIKALVILLPELIKAFVLLLPEVLKLILSMIPVLIVAVVKLIPILIDSIIQLIPELITSVIEAIPDIVEALINAIPDIFMAIVTLLPKIFIGLWKAAPKFFKAILKLFPPFFQNFIKWLISAVPKMFKMIWRFITGLFADITDSMTITLMEILPGFKQKDIDEKKEDMRTAKILSSEGALEDTKMTALRTKLGEGVDIRDRGELLAALDNLSKQGGLALNKKGQMVKTEGSENITKQAQEYAKSESLSALEAGKGVGGG